MTSITSCFIALLGFLSCSAAATAQDIVLVTNKSAQVSEISAADLRAIFVGEKTRFADGSHAVPVTLKGGPAHEVFLKNYVGQNPDEFRALWRKVVFAGQGAMPRAFDSESALIDYVAATPGALGYVSRISAQDNVKRLTTLR
jgi:ABC-type phosphate transport system substrate-binding protein